MRKTIAFFSALFAAFGALCQQAVLGAAAPESIQFPSMKVGETCSYVASNSGRGANPREPLVFTRKIVKSEGKAFLADFVDDKGNLLYRVVYAEDGNPVERINPDGRKFTLNEPYYNLPLYVGKRWEKSWTYTPPRGGNGKNHVTAEVMGIEDVKVPAGTFKTVKIELRGRYQDFGTADGDGAGEWTQTVWHSIETGCAVKQTSVSSDWFGKLFRSYTRELSAFTRVSD